MFKPLGILTFSLLMATPLAFAQPTTLSSNKAPLKSQTNIQQRFVIASKYTKHDYLIQISVPTGEVPSEGFPVLYVLDGNAAFDSAANIAKSVGGGANRLGLSPVAIVAIGYPQQNSFDVEKRALDYTPKASAEFQKQAKYTYGGADQFIQFIEKELKPAIQTKIKVNSQQQSLFGHSFGGLFVLHTFFSQPQMFQRYIAASPSLWFDNYALLNRQADWLKNQNKTQDIMLMTTVGTHEHGRSPTPDAESLQKQNNFYQNFNQQRSKHFLFWNYRHPAEQHLTNMYASLPKAIMLAGCQPQNCSNLFDEPAQQNVE
ncbi:alpha/beta hydrolase [Acinetobacter higginsii]|uniref:alpha/beta hydrolase n=1 Tax=Acinetobacter higginsii TaxID=70347 RepID=UPI001F4A80A0|nr:alpha/beta hydrolase-fold protein [Acinetobacter higginsii]MCH7340474.1 alpha/beta hydrolase-fold protein [Acinetobacter higginsii]